MTRRDTTKPVHSVKNTTKERIVLSVTRMTLHNGPGIRTLILFKGCPLHCPWCSTPESQRAEPEIAINPAKCTQCAKCIPACPISAIGLTSGVIALDRDLCSACGRCAEICQYEALTLLGKPMMVESLVELAKRDMVFYKHSGGGVTLSGGEPLLDPEFTGELMEALRKEGIRVGVDTCGHVPWSHIEPWLSRIEFFLWDIKHMNPEKHKALTGVSNELILRNARSASERNIPLYIRVPVIPGYNDSEENIRAVCEFSRSLTSVQEVHLLPLHHLGKARYDSLNRDYSIADIPLIPDGTLESMKNLVESYGLTCHLGG